MIAFCYSSACSRLVSLKERLQHKETPDCCAIFVAFPALLMAINCQRRTKKPPSFRTAVLCVGWKTGFEPATSGTTIQRSNLLSYIHHLGGQIYKIFYSRNPLKEIIPQATEERAGYTALKPGYLHTS